MVSLGNLGGLILQPANVLVLALAAAAVLLLTRWHRIGRRIVIVVAAVFLILLLLPIDKWLAAPLENRFPPPPEISSADGIIFLGGSFGNLYASAILAREFPAAKLVVVGGPENGLRPFADRARGIYIRLGIPAERIVVENRSRNTWENMVFAQKLVTPKPRERWLLVTPAVHMPRAIGVAQHLGWRLIPAPVGYISRTGMFARFDVAQNARLIGEAFHEYLGLAAYRLRGRTDAFWPGPQRAISPAL